MIHQIQPSAMLKIIVVMFKGRAGVIRRIYVHTVFDTMSIGGIVSQTACAVRFVAVLRFAIGGFGRNIHRKFYSQIVRKRAYLSAKGRKIKKYRKNKIVWGKIKRFSITPTLFTKHRFCFEYPLIHHWRI